MIGCMRLAEERIVFEPIKLAEILDGTYECRVKTIESRAPPGHICRGASACVEPHSERTVTIGNPSCGVRGEFAHGME